MPTFVPGAGLRKPGGVFGANKTAKRHVIESTRMRAGECWTECICGVRVEAPDPEMLAVAFGKHAGRLVRSVAYYDKEARPAGWGWSAARDAIDAAEFEWTADPDGNLPGGAQFRGQPGRRARKS